MSIGYLLGPAWPSNGEIDIIEYVNLDTDVLTTLHTRSGCDQSSEDTATFSGYWTGRYIKYFQFSVEYCFQI